MEKIIKKVINIIEKNGFEAYIVGGYVRDILLKRVSYDIDICTNALPKDLISLFPNSRTGIYGAVNFKIKRYTFEITTYRKEFKYANRKPSKVTYINNLLEDLQRRDFTINTLCMNSQGKIIDLLDAIKDVESHLIKCVGNTKEKIVEDPLRILRAIRLATLLNFDLDTELFSCIMNNSSLVQSLSAERIKEELDKILMSDNYQKGLNLLINLHLAENLGITIPSKMYKVNDLNGMWSQINIQNSLAFSKESRHNINDIKKILRGGKIDNIELYQYGLYLCLVAAEILGIDRKRVIIMNKKLPIHSLKDICVSTPKIINYLDLKEGNQIKMILDDLSLQILNKQVANNSKSIFRYLDSKKEDK